MTEFLILRFAGGCSKIAMHLGNTRTDSYYNLYINNIRGHRYSLGDWSGQWAERPKLSRQWMQPITRALHCGRRKTEECELYKLVRFWAAARATSRRRSQPGWAIQFYHNTAPGCKEFSPSPPHGCLSKTLTVDCGNPKPRATIDWMKAELYIGLN